MKIEHADWFFFFPVIVLMIWTLGLILMRIMRYSGVIPYKPFASRKEYLEAGLEMDLDLFIERAKATPRQVIEGEVTPRPKDREELNYFDMMSNRVSKLVDRMVSVAADEARSKLAQIPKKLDLSHVNPFIKPYVGRAAGISDFVSFSVPEKNRGWFRNKTGGALIYRAADHVPGSGWYHYNRADSSVQLLLARHEVEVAYPKRGEWWVKTDCVVKHAPEGVGWLSGPYKFNCVPDKYTRAAAECGCLCPVNYGKGLEKKSGDA